MRRARSVFVCLLVAARVAAADLDTLTGLLGIDLATGYDLFGPPVEVFPLRGEESWHDDVVFYYPDHVYLFWFQSRVWQLRVDRRYAGVFLGLKMGDGRATVTSVLGTPLASDPLCLTYQLDDIGYPVRLRLCFDEDRLIDAYFYRADF